jgi:hypothetical protein
MNERGLGTDGAEFCAYPDAPHATMVPLLRLAKP